ncbi:MAG: tRNA epoxyqueuosine(34) reductase QueG [Phormidesmis sp. RL_2_1]|nr:tRNA epoxyqueuosine(34) reductase QueG [Phormidesmis sp. RL_2_1]
MSKDNLKGGVNEGGNSVINSVTNGKRDGERDGERDGKIDSEAVKRQAIALGFHQVGIAPIAMTLSAAEQNAQAALQAWLAQGFQADMAWMNSDKRQDIRHVMPGAKSMICVALNYYTPQQRLKGRQYAKISRYGWGRDYHRILSQKLKQLAHWLRSQPSPPGNEAIEARPYADTGPVQDKFWAQQAGIGWIAKNGNVITRRYGSWVFLGEIITNLALAGDQPHTAHCGSCSRCLDACPTAAIRAPGVVDANRCIAYHTIENRAAVLPEAIAQNLQNWVAGCDICQDVCPWNQRFAQESDIEAFQPYPGNLNPTLTDLCDITDAAWNQHFPASALRRIKPSMLRRNARAALAAHRPSPSRQHREPPSSIPYDKHPV